MKRVIILGQANVGKTLFTLNFADYLGAKTINLSFQDSQRGSYTRTISVKDAVDLLVSDKPHHTRCLQSAVLQIPWGKGVKHFEIMDSAGLIDGIHENEPIRRAMAQTLATVRQAEMILHIFDCNRIAKQDILHGVAEVDYQVAQFGQLRAGYGVLANKFDLPQAKEGFDKLCQEFPGHCIMPISALYKQGFREVRDFVKRQL